MASDPGLPSDRNDPLLSAFLRAPDERRAEDELGVLLTEAAAPLLERVLRGQFGGASGAEAEIEDLRASSLLRLARQLQALRRGDVDPIASFAGYVAVTGFNAWRAWLRQRNPERARLNDRLRYVLGHHAALGLWPARSGEWVCGLGRLRPQGPLERAPIEAEALGRVLDTLPTGWARLGFAAQVAAILERLAQPCRVVDLATALGSRLGLVDPEPAGDRLGESVGDLPDPARGPVERLIGRQYLTRLWAEIQLLPRPQRVALLLNLRDEGGQESLGLFPLTGVAELPEIAAVLGLSEAELAAIWPELPRDDLWIAAMLGLSRRQVINLRKSARARLARRMGDR